MQPRGQPAARHAQPGDDDAQRHGEVRVGQLGPAFDDLRPFARNLDEVNASVRSRSPTRRDAGPPERDPAVRARRPQAGPRPATRPRPSTRPPRRALTTVAQEDQPARQHGRATTRNGARAGGDARAATRATCTGPPGSATTATPCSRPATATASTAASTSRSAATSSSNIVQAGIPARSNPLARARHRPRPAPSAASSAGQSDPSD